MADERRVWKNLFENSSCCAINLGAGTDITHVSFTVKWSIINESLFGFVYVLYRIKMLIKILVYQIIMFVTFQFSSIFQSESTLEQVLGASLW